MASNVITFLTVTALACLATVSAQLSLPSGVYCTTTDNTACTQRYPNSVCYHEEEVCKYGASCQCPTGYALYTISSPTSCRKATVPVGELCGSQVGNTCSGSKTFCGWDGTNYVCKCNSGYKPNADLTDCIPLNLGQNCTNGECGEHAYCDSRMLCRCRPGYKPFDATDCTHYVPGETCPVTECEFVESGAGSCGYGTCKNGVFGCTWGSRWWQYSTPNGEEPSPLVNGQCLKNTVMLVSTGELCDSSSISEYACRSYRCVRCPEQNDVSICNGAISSKTISAATSLILLLACYLFH